MAYANRFLNLVYVLDLTDVDECAANPCSANEICLNSYGSFRCLSGENLAARSARIAVSSSIYIHCTCTYVPIIL